MINVAALEGLVFAVGLAVAGGSESYKAPKSVMLRMICLTCLEIEVPEANKALNQTTTKMLKL